MDNRNLEGLQLAASVCGIFLISLWLVIQIAIWVAGV